MPPALDWRAELARLLPLFGHRNWILVADSAFPALVGAVEILATGEEHLTVLNEVMAAVEAAPHVRPVVWLDVELNALTEELAPGVEAIREALTLALKDVPTASVMHADLLDRLADVSTMYRVLVLKSTGVVPYSSVFIELDCGYWAARNEVLLRQVMEKVSVS